MLICFGGYHCKKNIFNTNNGYIINNLVVKFYSYKYEINGISMGVKTPDLVIFLPMEERFFVLKESARSHIVAAGPSPHDSNCINKYNIQLYVKLQMLIF